MWNIFQDREYIELEQPKKPDMTLFPLGDKRMSDRQEVSFNFQFDNVPDNMKIDVRAPRQLRINKEVRHRYGGIYG